MLKDINEFDNENRGTEFIKSPEMLQLSIKLKKHTTEYDRRKKVGTTAATDIWSLGIYSFNILYDVFIIIYML